MGLTRLAIRRPIVLLMAIAAIMILGWRARMQMPAELDPRVDIPIVNIETVYPGAGPEEVEQRVSRPIEDAVATVSNVTGVDSHSLENVSFVSVTLKLGSDINASAADIRARIESIRRDLPEEVQPSQIDKVDFNARPVMVLGVTGGRSLERLRALVDNTIKPRLSQVPGLGSVTVVGGRQREVEVRIDPTRLAAYGLTLPDVVNGLRASSQSAPAGSIVQGERDVAVRVLGEYRSLEDLRNTPIPVAPSEGMSDPRAHPAPSAPLRLRDVATVTEGTAPREQITRVGNKESIGLVLTRLSDANTVQVADGVKDKLDDLKDQLPPDVRITTLQDHSRAVADALEDINFTLVVGAILAILMVFVFLHSLKDTFIVACAIPISIVSTFLVMWAAGFSMNQMTMLALSLSVGILVDDSILVLESIHRHRAMGKSPTDAALDGREEIGLADAANTFVDVVVFIPIAFMGGIVGQFFRQFGLTIATATLASLYVSFSVTPMLAARWFRAGEGLYGGNSRFARWFDARYERLETVYRGVLAGALRHRLATVVAGFGALALVGLLAWQVLGFDFTPSVDRGQVEVVLELPPGASLKATDELMAQVEAEARKIPEVDSTRMLASVGEIIGGFGSLPDRGSQIGQLTLMLQEKQGFADRMRHPFGETGKRDRSDEQVAESLRRRLRKLAGAGRISVSAVRGLTSASAPIEIGLYGADLQELDRVSNEIQRRLMRVPLLQNVDVSLRRGKPELHVVYDRDKAEGTMVGPAELANVVRTAIAGNTDLRFREKDESVPIRVAVSRTGEGGLRVGPDAIRNLIVAKRGPLPVYVSDIADVRLGTGPTKIQRSERNRKVTISADIRNNASLSEARRLADVQLRGLLHRGVELKWEGDVNDMEDSAKLMTGALLLAIALSYMLMAALFNSFLHPLTIMVSVPMALVGGLLGLIVTGTTMNIVSMIGIVMLVGLVSKNAILLVDYTNTLRSRGLAREDAIRAAGPVRLRPILMTSAATIIAMTPVALQIGRASEMRAPMAIVVIGGLLLSTLLTLLVVPVMYTYFDDLTNAIVGGWNRAFPRKEMPEEIAAEPLEPVREPAELP